MTNHWRFNTQNVPFPLPSDELQGQRVFEILSHSGDIRRHTVCKYVYRAFWTLGIISKFGIIHGPGRGGWGKHLVIYRAFAFELPCHRPLRKPKCHSKFAYGSKYLVLLSAQNLLTTILKSKRAQCRQYVCKVNNNQYRKRRRHVRQCRVDAEQKN